MPIQQPTFTTQECAWSQTSLKLLGRTTTGLLGFEFDLDLEKEHLYAAGNKPIDIQIGNEKPTGHIKVLKYELDSFNDAAQLAGYDSLLHVPHTGILITCSFKKNANSPIRIITASGIAFSKMSVGMEQNAKMTQITLPFLAMSIKFL